MKVDNLPHILTAQEIADFLRIGRKRVYELLDLSPDHGGIPSFNVGRSRRVEREEFRRWLDRRKEVSKNAD